AFAADGAGERHHRCRAEEADIDAVHPESAAMRRHREVAARDKLAPGRGGDAMDTGDHRLRQTGEAEHDARAALEEVEICRAATVGRLARGLHLAQVVAGAEGAAGTGEDHDADALI